MGIICSAGLSLLLANWNCSLPKFAETSRPQLCCPNTESSVLRLLATTNCNAPQQTTGINISSPVPSSHVWSLFDAFVAMLYFEVSPDATSYHDLPALNCLYPSCRALAYSIIYSLILSTYGYPTALLMAEASLSTACVRSKLAIAEQS